MATKTIKPSGGDYTTATAWEAALPGTLTAEEIGELYYFSGGLDDKFVFSGHATTATNFGRLTVVAADRGNGFSFDTTKFYFNVSATGSPLTIFDNYTVFEYLQARWNTSSNSVGMNFDTGSDSSVLRYSLFDGQESTSSGGIYVGSGANQEMYRNSFWGTKRSFFGGIRVAHANAAKVYNNTLYNNYYGVRGNGTGQICTNNACFGNTDNFNGTFDTTNSGYNSTEDASGAPGSNNQYNLTIASELVNITAGSEDLHIKTTSTSKDNGSNLGSPYDVDAEGDTETGTWDIGADVLIAAAGGGIAPLRRRLMMRQSA